jgi:hypothetical protein
MSGSVSMRSIEPAHSGGACDPGAHQQVLSIAFRRRLCDAC